LTFDILRVPAIQKKNPPKKGKTLSFVNQISP
jgi:hypothetical protein